MTIADVVHIPNKVWFYTEHTGDWIIILGYPRGIAFDYENGELNRINLEDLEGTYFAVRQPQFEEDLRRVINDVFNSPGSRY